MRGSFPAPHHHDPNETLPNFQIWVMVVFPSPVTAGERLRDQRFLRAGVRLRYQRLQTLRRPCYRLLRHRSVLGPKFRRDPEHRSLRLRFLGLIPSSLLKSIGEYLWYWAFDVESLTVESCSLAEVVAPSKVAWCPRSWCWPGQHNQFALAAVGCPMCSTSRGQPPTWCVLWRCREMITKLLFEGVRRGIPGPTPSTGTNPRTGRGVSRRHPGRRRPPNFYSTGTNTRTGHH